MRRRNPSEALNELLGAEKARDLEESYGHDVRRIFDAPVEELVRQGISAAKAKQIKAMGVAVRDYLEVGNDLRKRPTLRSASDIVRWMQSHAEGLELEKFSILAMDNKNRPYHLYLISTGTVSASLVHPREVFAPLLRSRASSFCAVHNHPSGDPQPSVEDHEITKRLVEGAALLGLRFLDHVVMGASHGLRDAVAGVPDRDPTPAYVSFLERGVMPGRN